MMRAIRRLLIRSYIFPSIVGLLHTLYRLLFVRRFTLNYPEERLPAEKGYRGEHRLKRDEFGRPKCVACLMCQSACPARCITITARESPWPDREKVPLSFEIDMLKCIYCGMCEEACPCDAIELTPRYTVSAATRGEKVYDLVKLLGNDYVPPASEEVPLLWMPEDKPDR
jgi:NADH-quinone oxidoreductase subunit I